MLSACELMALSVKRISCSAQLATIVYHTFAVRDTLLFATVSLGHPAAVSCEDRVDECLPSSSSQLD